MTVMVSDGGQSVAAIEAQLREVAEKKAASLATLRVLAAQVIIALHLACFLGSLYVVNKFVFYLTGCDPGVECSDEASAVFTCKRIEFGG